MRHTTILALVAIAGCFGREPEREPDPRIADRTRPLILVTHPTEPPSSYVDASGPIKIG